MRLIDADALMDKITIETIFIKDGLWVSKIITDAPTIETSGKVTGKLESVGISTKNEDESTMSQPKSKLDHDKEWIIGCIKHDGFIKTDRFDKANQIILEALEPTEPSDLISRADALKELRALNRMFDAISFTEAVCKIRQLPSVSVKSYDNGYEDGINAERPKAYKIGYNDGYEKGKAESVSAERVGAWIKKDKYHLDSVFEIECNQCGSGMWQSRNEEKYPNYCYNCGAKMKGGAE